MENRFKAETSKLSDEELDKATGGMKTATYMGVNSYKYTAVTSSDGGGPQRCLFCDYPNLMNAEELTAHMKACHPDEYHYLD